MRPRVLLLTEYRRLGNLLWTEMYFLSDLESESPGSGHWEAGLFREGCTARADRCVLTWWKTEGNRPKVSFLTALTPFTKTGTLKAQAFNTITLAKPALGGDVFKPQQRVVIPGELKASPEKSTRQLRETNTLSEKPPRKQPLLCLRKTSHRTPQLAFRREGAWEGRLEV